MQQRLLINVSGIVQGVGFRPFIYQQAVELNLSGVVANNPQGVKIDIQGRTPDIAEFEYRLSHDIPVLAQIDSLEKLELELVDREGFSIEPSEHYGATLASISPDQASCEACIGDVNDPQSRYYRYPFTNCTNCGPRYTILKQLPYDRVMTSMSDFELCPSCASRYADPLDRRYHAQPIACPECGPAVVLRQLSGQCIDKRHAAIGHCAQLLKDGEVIAIKGIGGFHLVCDAFNQQAIARVRQLKQRARKPFALMVANQEVAASLVKGTDVEWHELSSSRSPIILMSKHAQGLLLDEVAPNVPYLGVMLPNTPLHQLLFEELSQLSATQALVMTSANLSGQVLATELEDLQQSFCGQLRYVLDHNRPIQNSCDDSLVHYAGGRIRVLRLGRGYAPLTLATKRELKPGIACGAQQKSTLALISGQKITLSPYIGELESLAVQQRYEHLLNWYPETYQLEVEYVVCDKHTGYFSTQKALSLGLEVKQVQHHHAHVLSAMAEFKVEVPVLGIVFDGTGLGDDHTIWGGEALIVEQKSYQRIGHLRQFKLIGGEKAIREPSRLLYALLLECYSPQEIQALNLGAFSHWSEDTFYNLYRVWHNDTLSPYCSSAGRLFDAWAVLLTLVDEIDYEGESGLVIENQAFAALDNEDYLSFDWTSDGELDWEPALHQSIAMIQEQRQNSTARICLSFIAGLAEAIVTLAYRYQDLPVVVSGGVFQNRILVDRLVGRLSTRCKPLLIGEKVPVNDAGIAIGQAFYVAACR